MRQDLGFRRGIAISLNHLGDVALALGDIAAAKQHFYEALQTAIDLRATPLALDSLVGWAACLARAGETGRAVELLQVTLSHAASGQEARDRARQLLAELKSPLPPELIAARQTMSGGEAGEFVLLYTINKLLSSPPD